MSSSPVFLDQSTHILPSFTLESGVVLKEAPVAYKTWGKLSAEKDNVMVITHALTGSADVQDWWGPMMGRRKAFDPSRYFIICFNYLGSPYGSASPLTTNPETGKPYGPTFPETTIRDDVRIQKLVLDHLGIPFVAVAIGGSMGGMHVVEWPLCTPPGYVRNIIPLSTSAFQSAWGIAWSEMQRQAVQADKNYRDGYYTEDAKPTAGLAAARACAMLTYRSRDSFQRKFGRKLQASGKPKKGRTIPTPPPSPPNATLSLQGTSTPPLVTPDQPTPAIVIPSQAPTTPKPKAQEPEMIFTAQSYLRYHGQKFITRFDANCFLHIITKMDTHDISRDRSPTSTVESELASLPPALVISISSDVLFPVVEQALIAKHIPKGEHVVIETPEGHDGFLLEFEKMNTIIGEFLRRKLPNVYVGEDLEADTEIEGFEVKKTSVFGEAEADEDAAAFTKPEAEPQSQLAKL